MTCLVSFITGAYTGFYAGTILTLLVILGAIWLANKLGEVRGWK